MTFERKLVGAAFVATLMGRTSALERVFLERETAYWPETESPALAVYVRDERNQKLSADPLTYERSLDVWVDLYVRDSHGELVMGLAHDLSKQVEDLLHPVLFQGFPGLPITVNHEETGLESTVYDQDPAGERIDAGVRQTWKVVYHTEHPTHGPAACDHLKSMAVDWDFPPPDFELEAQDVIDLTQET